jgi:hypothetical protein
MSTKCKNEKDIVSLRVMDFIHYKESLMILGTYVTTFGLLILQGFHIKQKKLICQKLILILQGIIILFSKDPLIIIYLEYFSLLYVVKGEN